jgi:hypothetical protein
LPQATRVVPINRQIKTRAVFSSIFGISSCQN